MSFDFGHHFIDKRVFLTGHTGFKGSWLALWLQKLGAHVTGYALDPPTMPSNYEVSKVSSGLVADHRGHLCDRKRLQDAITAAEPHLIMHLAAQSVVRTGYEAPYETFETNVMGTASLLDAVRMIGRPCAVLCVTSDKCYENVEQVWGYREQDRFGDYDPYGGSKGAAELVIRTYRKAYFPSHKIDQHGVALASARAGNVIGGGDWKAHALLPDAFRALADDQSIPVRNPHAYRPWQHVLQCLSGYLTLATKLLGNERQQFCSGWNIGPLPGGELPVHQLIEHFLEEWGEGDWTDASDADQPREANILRLCIDKAIWRLGWKPRWGTTEAIRQTARWYRQYLTAPETMRDFSLRQIERYEVASPESLEVEASSSRLSPREVEGRVRDGLKENEMT